MDGASIPRSPDLPDDLKPLGRRNALRVSDTGFNDDCRRLVTAIKEVLEQNAAELREREEKGRLEIEQKRREELEKQRVHAEDSERQRLAAEQREKERVEKHKRNHLDTERRETEPLEAEARQREEKERLKAEKDRQEQLETERLEKDRLDAEKSEKQRLAAQQREKELVEVEQRERKRFVAQRGKKEHPGAERNERRDPGPWRIGRVIIAGRYAKTFFVLGSMAVLVVLIMSVFQLGTNHNPRINGERTVVIRSDNYCDLVRGIELSNDPHGDSDFIFRVSYGMPYLYPSPRSGFVFLKKADGTRLDQIALGDIESLNFGDGTVRFPLTRADRAAVAAGEFYGYRLRNIYYGALRVVSVAPDLVISFVNYR